jgi:hypothetical protein
MNGQEYMVNVDKASLEELFEDLADQTVIVAEGLRSKMRMMQFSFKSITFTLIIIFILVLLRLVETAI